MVFIDSSFNSRTVFETFQDMSLGPDHVEMNYVKSWKSRWMPNNSLDAFQEKFPWFFKHDEFKKNYKSPTLSDVQTVLGVFKEHKDNLITMLVLLDYTWNIAEEIIECIINDFQSSLLETCLLPTSDYDNNCLEVVIYEVSRFGRYLSSALCNGMHCSLLLLPDDLMPFYCFFIQKCYESTIPNIISFNKLDIKPLEHEIPCPMVIYEDADIASAVSSFCKSVNKFKTTSADVVSHLFIQESVFDNTISLLESALKKMRHGSRYDKKTELEYNIPSEEIETSSHNLKVFTPYQNSPIQIFVGWSPTDTDQSDLLKRSRGHIPSLPFRNSDDLKILLKALQPENWFYNSISVWGEKISNIRTLPCELQFCTLWINSHGLTHPLIPCNLHTYVSFPILEQSCIEIDLPLGQCHFKSNLVEALEESMETFKTWHFNKAEIKLKFLEPLGKVFTSSRQSRANIPRSKSVNQMIKCIIDTKLTECLASKAKVMTEYCPVGVVLVAVLNTYEKLEIDLTRLVSSLLIQGNAVVVAASSRDLVEHSANILKEMYKTTSPYNLLTFLVYSTLTSSVLNGLYSAHIKIRLIRLIYIGGDINSPFTRDNCTNYSVAKQNNYLHDDDYCFQLSTISKCTWLL